jgi:hypothetical protein
MSEIIESVKPAEMTPSELDLVSGGLTFNLTNVELSSYQQSGSGGSGSQESHK